MTSGKRNPGPLTWKEANTQLDYNPETGIVTWVTRKSKIYPGKRAGWLNKKGYRGIVVCGTQYPEHRFIWFWMTGENPLDKYIDHINHNKSDNRWCNLRLATHGENYVNSNTFGPNRGISKRNGNYRVKVTKDGVRKTYTVYTLEAARILRKKLEKELYGEFACERK